MAELDDGFVPTDPNHQPVSLSLIRLRTWSSTAGQFGYETHVHGEAAVAASLVAALLYCAPDDDIFIATPHRVQREAVKTALAKLKRPERTLEERWQTFSVGDQDDYLKNVTVDTVERLQGMSSFSHHQLVAKVKCVFFPQALKLPLSYASSLSQSCIPPTLASYLAADV